MNIRVTPQSLKTVRPASAFAAHKTRFNPRAFILDEVVAGLLCMSLDLPQDVSRPELENFARQRVSRIRFGASPRATIALDRCARAHAWLLGKDYVAPEDVQAVAHDVLRHRLLLSFEAEADGMTPESLLDDLLRLVPVA